MKNSVVTDVVMFSAAVLLFPYTAAAQQERSQAPPTLSTQAAGQQSNVPAEAQEFEEAVERTVERFGIGVQGGVGLDPEIIDFGAHATFAPIFDRNVEFRPGIEIGVGELTTLLGINLDVVYILPGATTRTQWMPYIGAGPTFGLSHRGFETDEEDEDNVDVDGPGVDADDDRNRFDFSDTDFNGGLNFIAGARNQDGLFFEVKATAYGVSTIRLLAGFNF